MNNLMNNAALIDIMEFDERPGPFSMSYRFDLNAVVSSISRAGLINRPYVRRNKEGSMDIITGYRRILALKALDRKTVPCIDLTDSGLSDADLFFLNLHDNLCTRRFNFVEKGMILNRLMIFLGNEGEYHDYLLLLDVSSRREADILTRIKDLDDHTRSFIADGAISLKTVESLLEMKEPCQSTILKWITKLKLNVNQQMLFIEYIDDISIREGKGAEELLDEDVFVNTLSEDQTNNAPQMAKRIIDLLRARRLPLLTKNEKAFYRQISGLSLPKGVRIKHSPYFEGPDYLLEINFRDGNSLKEKIHELSGLKGLSKISPPGQNSKGM